MADLGKNIDHSDFDQIELTAEILGRPGTLILPISGEKAVVDAAGRVALFTHSQIQTFLGAEIRERLMLYLGRVYKAEGIPGDGISVASHIATIENGERVPVLALLLETSEENSVPHGNWLHLREMVHNLDPYDAGLLAKAVALSNWHRHAKFSPSTGLPTTIKKGGWVRVSETDGKELFPRTDPAVIVAVTDENDRILLASNTAWNHKVFSLIAGFVDPGESLEQAVIREVFEESGVRVSEPKYLGSQPWPFPSSLMLGFQALADGSSKIRPDGVEIRALRWFSRKDLRAAVSSGEIIIPGASSISRAIIDSWHGEPF